MTIVISPYAKELRNGKQNPKNFPHWERLVEMLINNGHEVIQIGIAGEPMIPKVTKLRINLTFKEISWMLLNADLFISVDTFLPHLANYYGVSNGIVIWSQSDPEVFGYSCYNNVIKDRKYIRQRPFEKWDAATYNEDAFVTAEQVFQEVCMMSANVRT